MPFTFTLASRQPGSVVKNLNPGGASCTHCRGEHIGNEFMYARYHVNTTIGHRHTTIELLTEDRTTSRQPSAEQHRPIFLLVGAIEKNMQSKANTVGGMENPQSRLWILPYCKTKALSWFQGLSKMSNNGYPSMDITGHIWKFISRYGHFCVMATSR